MERPTSPRLGVGAVTSTAVKSAPAMGLDLAATEQSDARSSSRRTPRDVARLETRLLALLREWPGLTRAETAVRLSVPLAALHRPVTNLLHAGRIRRDGHKSRTRYWPDLARSPGPLPEGGITQRR